MDSDSICVVKLTFYLRASGSSEELAEGQNLMGEPHLDDEEKEIAALGGIKLQSFWFEKEVIGTSSDRPKTKEVIAEIKYWLNR
jgi:hypothetical protein